MFRHHAYRRSLFTSQASSDDGVFLEDLKCDSVEHHQSRLLCKASSISS